MKMITLIFLCAALSTAAVRAEEFHLVQTQIQDASAPGVPVESLTIYVLVSPDHRPQVFKTFNSTQMEAAIGNLPRGSVLHYDANAMIKSPPDTQLQALIANCKKRGISLMLSPTN
jgi:hypothetical protein